MDKPGFTKSDKPKSMAFNCEFSSFDVNKKFWWNRKQHKIKVKNATDQKPEIYCTKQAFHCIMLCSSKSMIKTKIQ